MVVLSDSGGCMIALPSTSSSDLDSQWWTDGSLHKHLSAE